MAQELPKLNLQPQYKMPQGQSQYSGTIAELGNVMQRFSGAVSQQAQSQIGAKEKVEEMTLKNNIDNSMRSFAKSNMNIYDPKSGIAGFENQAKEYTNKLLDNVHGVHADYMKAYAQHSMATNAQPLQTQVTKQAFNTARMQVFSSAENTQKNISQLINQVPWDNAIEFHSLDKDEKLGENYPHISAAQHHMAEMLNHVDASMASGILPFDTGQSIKKKLLRDANDQMLYHTYNLALDNGQGEEFLTKYAQSQRGKDNYEDWERHIAHFKKIEDQKLATYGVSRDSAKKNINENLKRIEDGEDGNPMASSIAKSTPTLHPDYDKDEQTAKITGGYYKQFTSGTPSVATQQYAYLTEQIKNSNISDNEKLQRGLALNKASEKAQQYFKDFHNDPAKYINQNNLLGDIATTEMINSQNGIQLSDAWKNVDLETLDAMASMQIKHGIPLNQVSFLENATAKQWGGQLLSATPQDKVKMVQSINDKYGKYAPQIFNQLMKKGGVPDSYRYIATLDPDSGDLPDMVAALTTKFDVNDEQSKSIKNKISQAMDLSEIPHPNIGTTHRLLSTLTEGIFSSVTGRESRVTEGTTGLFGSPGIYSQSTPWATRLKALHASMASAGGFNNAGIRNNMEESLNKMVNYYMQEKQMNENDAFTRATNVLTDQYDFWDYKNNTLRIPKNKVNGHDVQNVLHYTPDFLNKINWSIPDLSEFGGGASRVDKVNYYQQNIENGHWATTPNDDGLVWTSATGMVPKMQNGNPFFISFDSMSKLKRLDLSNKYWDSDVLKAHTQQMYQLFEDNNVAFNEEKLLENTENVEGIDKIKDSFGMFERMTSGMMKRSQSLHDMIMEDREAKQRKYAQKSVQAKKERK